MTVAAGLLHQAEEHRRSRAVLRARLSLARALHAANRTDQAAQTVGSAIITCVVRGLQRPLLDGGPRILDLLEVLDAWLRAPVATGWSRSTEPTWPKCSTHPRK
ncbi:hypothetical protein EEB14_08605 [Rhodococcus sp. WS4]|nr:hypothetical protein EEB14_08605 [Rhodococcus sp. WS4]